MSQQLFDEAGQPANEVEEQPEQPDVVCGKCGFEPPTQDFNRHETPCPQCGKEGWWKVKAEPPGDQEKTRAERLREMGPPDDEFARLQEKDVKTLSWKAVDDSEVEVTIDQFGRYLMPDTAAGDRPSLDDIVRTMMFCRALRVDPWSRDCHIVGYSGYRRGNKVVEPRWEVLVSHRYKESLAESHPAFEGIESGITILRGGEIVDREGCQIWPGEELLGGWAKVYRSDRRVPRVKKCLLSRFKKDSDFWRKSPGPEHMIAKTAESQAYTAAFPKMLGTAITPDEVPNDDRLDATALKTIDANTDESAAEQGVVMGNVVE